ncbi:MAG: hypothetical protein Q8942_12220, partial [Bacillota bacterium]|nr:hypothetical protein [Bacillota bacterium]
AYDYSNNFSDYCSSFTVTSGTYINSDMTLNEDKVYGKLFITSGTLNLNGHSITVTSDVIHSGGTIFINGGRLEVKGDYKIQTEAGGNSDGILEMVNVSDYVKIDGSFVMQSNNSHNGLLTAGTLEIKGNFTQKPGTYYAGYWSGYADRTDNFYASGSHKVLLSGNSLQTIYFQNPGNSPINILEFKNNSNEGIKTTSNISVASTITNNCMAEISGISAATWFLSDDVILNNNLTVSSGGINLNGHKLTVKGNLYLAGGAIDLNSQKLCVYGNLIHTGGTMNINKGFLEVKGDYRIQTEANGNSDGILRMVNDSDYVKVEGNFVMQSNNSHNELLTAGTMELMGNFTQKPGTYYGGYWSGYVDRVDDFKPTGTHKVILSGNGLQTIYFQNTPDSCFNILEFKNSSSEGIKATSALCAGSIITNGCVAEIAAISTMSWSLSDDITVKNNFTVSSGTINLNGHQMTVEGNLYFNGGTIDLNGQKLCVKGNLIQSGGVLNINKGHLEVKGDYKIQAAGEGNSDGSLTMINEADYVEIDGNFLTQSNNTHNGLLTAGIMEIKGNFEQRHGTYYGGYWSGYVDRVDNFKATGTHKVILSGSSLQTIYFQNPVSSGFNVLECGNESNDGIKAISNIYAGDIITNNCIVNIPALSSMNWSLSQDTTFNGNLTISGSDINLNGHQLTINGNLIHTSGTLIIGGGQLEVKGDYRLQTEAGGNSDGTLKMVNEADYVKVLGNFIMQSNNSHNGLLTAGKMEIKGNFTQNAGTYYGGYWTGNVDRTDNFKASGTHKVVLTGSVLQTVNFQNPVSSGFCVLELNNNSKEGIKFTSAVYAATFITNKCKAELPTVSSMPWTLSEDVTINNNFTVSGSDINLNGHQLTINGNLYLNSGSIDLNNQKLCINGNLIQSGGTLNVNGGLLVVKGDYRIQTEAGEASDGILKMVNETDFVKIEGSFITQSNISHYGLLNAGTMEVKGNFTQKPGSYYGGDYWSGYVDRADSFRATGTHKVVLSGNEKQAVSFQNPSGSSFNILGITKSLDEGYTFNTKPVWNKVEEIMADQEPPTVPTNLIVTDTSHYTVALSWEKSTDNKKISGYYIYRDNEKVGDTSSNLFIDNGLKPDTNYIYEVKAYDTSDNESGSSNKVKATTKPDPEAPSVPAGLKTISKTDRTITISWEASADNVGVKGYIVYRSRKIVGTTDKLTFTDSGLSPKTRYSYQIKAFDDMGNYSDSSIPLFETTLEDVEKPTIPGKPVISEITETSAKISWEKSEDNYTVKGYEVYRDNEIIGATSDTFYNDSQLQPDKTYEYYVRAFDSAPNYSSVSESVYAVTVVDIVIPSIPGNLTFKSKDGQSVTFAWEKSTDNVAVKGYNIYRDGGNLVGSTDKLIYTDSGLVQNKAYTYTIKAVDTSGNESKASNELKAAPGIPDMPNGLIVTPGVYSLDVSWEPVKSEGFSYFKLYNGSESLKLNFWKDVKDGVKATMDSLPCGTTEYFAVSAVDIWGNEGPKAEISGTTIVDTIVPTIKLFQPTDGTKTSNRYIALKANGIDNGVINKFVFEYSVDSGTTWTKIAEADAVYGSDSGEYKGQTLWNNDSTSGKYMFKVSAVDKEGNVSEPVTSNIILDYLPPLVPQVINAIAAAGRNIITWNKVTSEDISRYRIYRKTGDENFTRLDNVDSNTLIYIDNNAIAGETYFYAISAIDELSNESDLSESIQVTTVNYSPTLTMTPLKGGPETELSFEGKGFKPAELVDLYIDGTYLISSRADENGDATLKWKFVKNVTSGSHKFILKGQTSLTLSEADFTAEVKLPSPPNNLTATIGQMEISLGWSIPKDSSVGCYRVYRKKGADSPVMIFDNVKILTVKDIDVLKDTEYGYQVSTVDIYGNEGVMSDVVNAKPLMDTDKPIIKDFNASRSGSIIKLTADVKDNIGVSRVKYLIRINEEWKEITAIEMVPQRNNLIYSSYDWETRDIQDGFYEVEAVAYDTEGNASLENVINVSIRNTPPKAPAALTAVPGEMKVELTWTEVSDSELDKYKLLRSTDGVNFQIVYTTNLLSYTDTKVDLGSNYTYRVIAVDKYGHESSPTTSDAVKPNKDMTAPVISGFEPLEGATFGSIATITVRAEDNVQLQNITLQYSIDGGNKWSDAAKIETKDNAVIRWNTASLSGDVKVRAIAEDMAGNKSNGLPVITYHIDTSGPSRVTGLSAVPSITSVTLKWNSIPDNDFSYFQVEKKDSANGTYYSVGTSQTILGLNVNGLATETTYWFRVACYDILGNRGKESDEIQVTTLKDTIAPVVNSI